MIPQHRTAFQMKKGNKTVVAESIDSILNLCHLKMKEMMNEINRISEDTACLRTKEEKLNHLLENVEETIEDKKLALEEKYNSIQQIEKENKQIEEEYRQVILDYNNKDEKKKEKVNQANYDLESIKYGVLPEKSQYFAEIKKNCELIQAAKEEKALLQEQLNKVTRELGVLERERAKCSTEDKLNFETAEKGKSSIENYYNNFLENYEKRKEEDNEEEFQNEENEDEPKEDEPKEAKEIKEEVKEQDEVKEEEQSKDQDKSKEEDSKKQQTQDEHKESDKVSEEKVEEPPVSVGEVDEEEPKVQEEVKPIEGNSSNGSIKATPPEQP